MENMKPDLEALTARMYDGPKIERGVVKDYVFGLDDDYLLAFEYDFIGRPALPKDADWLPSIRVIRFESFISMKTGNEIVPTDLVLETARVSIEENTDLADDIAKLY